VGAVLRSTPRWTWTVCRLTAAPLLEITDADGLADVLEIGAGETHMIGAVRVSAVHAQHDERRWPDAVEVGAIVVSDAIRVAAIQLEESWRHSSSYARSPSLESQRTAERRGRLVVK